MLILSIDIGSTNYGYSILKKLENKKYELVKTNFLNLVDLDIATKLTTILRTLKKDIQEHKIELLVFENSVFRGSNAALLNYVCGLTYVLSGTFNLPVKDVTPTQVKKRVTGNGKATKKEVELAVNTFLSNPPESYLNDHCSDAVAIGIAGTL